jgi:hypothetical protein
LFGYIDAQSRLFRSSLVSRVCFLNGRPSAYRRVGLSISGLLFAAQLVEDHCDNLPVAIANSIVRLTTSASGFQDFLGPSRSSPDGFLRSVRPPRKNDRSPQRSPATSLSLSRCWLHRGHSKRKCLTVSLVLLVHSHWLDSAAWILARYSFSRLFPARCFDLI